MNAQNDLRQIYDRAFYAEQIDGSARSARVVVPALLDLIREVNSVVDVGCGAGAWLSRFKDSGVDRVLGMDGGDADEHGQLEIERAEFRSCDFEQEISVGERFGLCICLEVAEHLTEKSAPALVRNLCSLSDVVLFSAAVPGQGGTNHLNERWPSYWADLFAEEGYRALDIIRGRFWNDARIEWWHRQNMLLFANTAGLARISHPAALAADVCPSTPLDIVHPECFSILRSNYEHERDTKAVADAQRQRQHVEELERQLREVLDSTSWKLTYPIRRLIGERAGLRSCLRRAVRLFFR